MYRKSRSAVRDHQLSAVEGKITITFSKYQFFFFMIVIPITYTTAFVAEQTEIEDTIGYEIGGLISGKLVTFSAPTSYFKTFMPNLKHPNDFEGKSMYLELMPDNRYEITAIT